MPFIKLLHGFPSPQMTPSREPTEAKELDVLRTKGSLARKVVIAPLEPGRRSYPDAFFWSTWSNMVKEKSKITQHQNSESAIQWKEEVWCPTAELVPILQKLVSMGATKLIGRLLKLWPLAWKVLQFFLVSHKIELYYIKRVGLFGVWTLG